MLDICGTDRFLIEVVVIAFVSLYVHRHLMLQVPSRSGRIAHTSQSQADSTFNQWASTSCVTDLGGGFRQKASAGRRSLSYS